jgi:uncharacterized protein YdaU (DUF1376 family)
MNKPPAYQHYAQDWLVGTAKLTLEEQGAYQRLLDHQWVDGPLDPDHGELARILGVTPRRFAKLWKRLARQFPMLHGDGDRLANPRLELERQKQMVYRAQQAARGRAGGQASAEARGEAND